MSSSTAIIYGRGFETNKIRFKTVLRFIQNHYQTIRNNIPNGNFIVKYALEINLDSIPDDFEAKDYKDLPIPVLNLIRPVLYNIWKVNEILEMEEMYPVIIAEVISNETNVRVQFEHGQEECEGEPSILFAECNPWHLNNTEKTLNTTAEFDAILEPYIKELGLDISDIDNLKIENYG